MQISGNHACVAAALAVALLSASAGAAVAQPTVSPPNFHSGSNTGIGYSAVFPSALAGAGAWHIFGGSRIGIFADVKFTQPSVTRDANYCPEALSERTSQCDVESVQAEYNHQIIDNLTEWALINGGGMYALTEEFALMLGVGMARERRVREYIDITGTESDGITDEGNYYVPFAEGATWGVQAVAGMMIRAGQRIAFSFGYETAPGNMNAGIYLVLH